MVTYNKILDTFKTEQNLAEKEPNAHYRTAIQPIKFMEANLTHDEFVGFLKGNIIKYAARCGRKDEPLQEAKKIAEYAKWLVEVLDDKKVTI